MFSMTSGPTYVGRDLEAMTFARNYHKWIVDELRPYLGEKVAEVGAGSGNFSELLMAEVTRLVAFEPSENMSRLLKNRFTEDSRVEVINATFGSECARFEGRLDTIIYVNVLEHIEDDEQELTDVYRTLAHGGHGLFFVPALPFLYSPLDKSIGHFRRYRKEDLLKLAQRVGFNVREARHFDFSGIVPWYIAFVLVKRPQTSRKVFLYDRLAVPLVRRLERLVRPPIGKNLLLVARKP